MLMRNKLFTIICLCLVVLSIYLFVTAPVELQAEAEPSEVFSVELAFQVLQLENSYAREIYTKEIVGTGNKQGMKFNEHWKNADLVAGLLPAQFLRETSRSLEQNPVLLGLFLGSDFAINSANNFEGDFLAVFEQLKEQLSPMFFYVEDAQRYAYLAPDVAIADPCVVCHNEHKDSPKTDWVLNDVMGAATWTYPKQHVTHTELLTMLAALRKGVSDAYQMVLDELLAQENPPVVGNKWPREGYYLPSLDEFNREIHLQSSAHILKLLMSADILITDKVKDNIDD